MDIPRPEMRRKRQIRQVTVGALVVIAVIAISVLVSRLEPAAPSVPLSSVWIAEVNEGEMLRQVRGPGELVPREIRWVPAQIGGRVERIVVRPGAPVEPDTILVEMSNTDLLQQVEEARLALAAAQAELTDTEIRLKREELDQRAAVGIAHAEHESALLQAEAEKELTEEGILPALQYRRSELLAEQNQLRLEIEEERLSQFSLLMEAQLASQQARVDQAQVLYERRLAQVESLKVRAGLAGVLQELGVEEGERIEMGANIARVARPDELQAELRIPETQARDVLIGQHVDVDTRNGIVKGRVMRIDPAAQSGTVQVDVELIGKLPRGARPSLSVDGTIEIERVERTVYTGRPAYGQADTTIGLFKIEEDGEHAVRVPVRLGRTSVNEVEILQGLTVGDRVILSDTSSWDDYDRIRLD
jgi:HlyD family secretion protein